MSDHDNIKRLGSLKPGIFSPTIIKSLKDGGGSNDSYVSKQDSATESFLSLGSSSSFKYDIPGSGIKSTQQLNIDWSKYENHTFFNSAQVKTNVAFDTIVNNYPFDGTKEEIETFFDKLTGFELYVYDQMPKQRGYLYFSGSSISDGSDQGTYVTVKDSAGAQFPSLSNIKTGETSLDPGLKSMTLESWLYVNKPVSGSRVSHVINKVSGSSQITGYAIESTSSSSLNTSTISMIVVSGGIEQKTSVLAPVNEWAHVSFIWNRSPGVNQIYGYVNNELQASSSMPVEIGLMNIGSSDMYVGSGSAIGTSSPNCTYSGSIDELRIWNDIRIASERKESLRKPVYSTEDLKLYFKFNEPSASNTNAVLDSSGGSLHGRLNTNGVTLGVREIATGSLAGSSPMTYETLVECPNLFPTHVDNVTLRTNLLLSASLYDQENPNLITRLIPKHYFDEGMIQDSLDSEEGDILTDLTGDGPKEASLGSTQVTLSLLYTWAKFFDEMKLYIQAFSTLKAIDYDETDTVPSDFLSVFARNEGIELPPMFVGTSLTQYVEGQNLDSHSSKNILGLQTIQNKIWRRILVNLQDVLKSKGTIHSIKSFIRSTGINPDNNFRIREYGGPSRKPLTFNREKRFEVSTMLNFASGGMIVGNELTSSAKTEPGFPEVGGNAFNNGLLTSGSFTYEAIYKWEAPPKASASYDGLGNQFSGITQSLSRMEAIPNNTIFGTQTSSEERRVIANLLAVTSSNSNTTLELVVKSTSDAAASAFSYPNVQELRLPLTGANIFNGKKWNISWGRKRGDDDASVPSYKAFPSSSFFLRAARQENGEILEIHTTSSYYDDNSVVDSTFFDTQSVFQSLNKMPESNGLRLVVGSGSHPIELTGGSHGFLTSSFDTSQDFSGKICQIRYWSKFLKMNEWKEHVVNYKSSGVNVPSRNYNFNSENGFVYTPTSILAEKLEIWYNPDTFDTSSGNWGNKVIGGLPQLQATAGAMSLVTSGSLQGVLVDTTTTVQTPGTTLQDNTANLISGSYSTVWFVHTLEDPPPDAYTNLFLVGPNYKVVRLNTGTGRYSWSPNVSFLPAISLNGTDVTPTVKAAMTTYDSTATQTELLQNGVSAATGAGTGFVVDPAYILLFQPTNDNIIHEMIIAIEPTEAQKNLVTSYLIKKWGLSGDEW